MQWDEGLLEDQKKAACHIGSHARLLAGPGTGKTFTLTRRAAYLITERGISPNCILALTFTRHAAYELRNRINDVLSEQGYELPRVCTLHSFALRQLLRNSTRINTLPKPLRIADDWEERNIIYEDLKEILGYDLKAVSDRFNQLSADWQTLEADKDMWEEDFRDPRFLGAWRKHREIFGYTLRSELVYQLKRGLEHTQEFSLESNYTHLLVDEYQDLNHCDLEVIFALRDKGIEVFGTGDDDQSIYGFRYANPEGIRRFKKDFHHSSLLRLSTCVRCDRKIIELALFIANLDPYRLEKPLEACKDAEAGEVYILRFRDQKNEANGVSNICKYLLEKRGFAPQDILILMRSDWKGAFSSVIKENLEAYNIPVKVRVEGTPLDEVEGRIFFSFLRLLADNNDSLAIRTLLKLRKNGVGKETFSKLYEIAKRTGLTFSATINKVIENPDLIPTYGHRIFRDVQEIKNILNSHRKTFDALNNSLITDDLLTALQNLAEQAIEDANKKAEVIKFLETIIEKTNSTNHSYLIQALSSCLEDQEQEIDPQSINVMTMHKAKGLTAKAVIIIAAEDEYIPGRQTGEKEDDERRLLYVSLSRSRHFLAVTYCERRYDRQRYTGKTRGNTRRTLTRFLRDSPIIAINGESFVKQFEL